MRGFVSAVPWGRREARYATAAVVVVVGLALLFIFPAPERIIQAEDRFEGLDESRAATVTVSEGQGASLQWVSDDEIVLTAVAPGDALITLFSGQATLTFTLHDLIMYTEREWPTPDGGLNGERCIPCSYSMKWIWSSAPMTATTSVTRLTASHTL